MNYYERCKHEIKYQRASRCNPFLTEKKWVRTGEQSPTAKCMSFYLPEMRYVKEPVPYSKREFKRRLRAGEPIYKNGGISFSELVFSSYKSFNMDRRTREFKSAAPVIKKGFIWYKPLDNFEKDRIFKNKPVSVLVVNPRTGDRIKTTVRF